MYSRMFYLILVLIHLNVIDSTQWWKSLSPSYFNTLPNTSTNDSLVQMTSTVANISRSLSGSPIYPNTTSDVVPIVISFVNGIYHSEEDWNRISHHLCELFEVKVFPFYNPSSGSWLTDATSICHELIKHSDNSVLSQQLAQHLRNILYTLPKQGRILHIAHSGGAILTYLAAKHHLRRNETDRIDILTFGGGRSITNKYFRRGRVINYYAKNDPCLFIETRAKKLLSILSSKRKKDVKYLSTIQNATDNRISNSTLNVDDNLNSIDSKSIDQNLFEEIKYVKHNTSFIFVRGMTQNAVLDHSMEGPTYESVLKYESKEMHKRMQSIIKQIQRDESIIRRLRKASANITGWHHFWDAQFQYDNAILSLQTLKETILNSSSDFQKFFWYSNSAKESNSITMEVISVLSNKENDTICKVEEANIVSTTVSATN